MSFSPLPDHPAARAPAPAIQPDRERQRVADGMQHAAQPRCAKARGEQDADRANERDFGDDASFSRDGEEDEDEGQEEAAELRRSDHQETGQRFLECRTQIFRETLPHLAQRAIHPHCRKGERLAVAQHEALVHPRRHRAPERHVFHHMIVQRRVPADGFVARPREEHELAVRRAEHPPIPRRHSRSQGRMFLQNEHQPVRIQHHPQQHDHRDDELFAQSHCQQPRPCRNQSRPRPLRIRHRRRNRPRRMGRIRIREKQILPARRLRELMTRPAFPRPPRRQRFALQKPRAFSALAQPEPAQDFTRCILGVIVEHEQLEVRIILRQQRPRTRRDIQRLIARRDEDGNQRRIRPEAFQGFRQAIETRQIPQHHGQRPNEDRQHRGMVE